MYIVQAAYGCPNFSPRNFSEKDIEDCTAIKQQLREQYLQKGLVVDDDIRKKMMGATFFLQRKELLAKDTSVKTFIEGWPLTQHPTVLIDHFDRLTGICLQSYENCWWCFFVFKVLCYIDTFNHTPDFS